METNGMVVTVKEKKGTRYILVPRAPTKEEQAAVEARDYLVVLRRNIAVITRKVAAVTAEHLKLIRPERSDFYGLGNPYSSPREARLAVLEVAPTSRGRHGLSPWF